METSMNIENPTIAPYMTKLPFTIGKEETLLKAEKLMDYLKVRHLPVVDKGQLVGILTDRDIKLVETLKNMGPDKLKVADAYTDEPLAVSSNSLVSEVCEAMALNKFGSVLVVDNDKLVGIFTWIDALHAMNAILNKNNPSH